MDTYTTSHTDLKDNDNHMKHQVRLEHETKKINIIKKTLLEPRTKNVIFSSF